MKTILSLILVLAAQNLYASLYCSAHVNVNAEYITGQCAGNQCNATVFPSTIFANGYCDKGVMFTATTRPQVLFLNGTCVNGKISIYKNSDYYSWSGSCSNGGIFNAWPTFIQSEYLYGNCSENGSMNIYIPPSYISLDGQCS